MTLKNTCFNCGHTGLAFKSNKYKKVCPDCGAWIANMESEVDFSSIYGQSYFLGEEYLNYELGRHVHRKNFERKFEMLKKVLPSGKELRILEIGCATGDFLLLARNKGVKNLLGVEISDFARAECTRENLEVLSPMDPLLNERIKTFCPNVIVAWDVWEHLDKPSEIFEKIIQFADQECVIALTTVDSGSRNARNRQEAWRQFHPPSHINYPSKKSFEIFFAKSGFHIKNHFYFGYYRPLAEYMAALLGPRKIISESKFFFRIPFYLNLYDTQMVVAKRG